MKTKLLFLMLVLLTFISGCESSIVDDPSTIIDYAIPKPSRVHLTIENSYNTVITTIVNDDQEAGVYQYSFDSSNLAEDIYFYKLEARSIEDGTVYIFERHMLLVK